MEPGWDWCLSIEALWALGLKRMSCICITISRGILPDKLKILLVLIISLVLASVIFVIYLLHKHFKQDLLCKRHELIILQK